MVDCLATNTLSGEAVAVDPDGNVAVSSGTSVIKVDRAGNEVGASPRLPILVFGMSAAPDGDLVLAGRAEGGDAVWRISPDLQTVRWRTRVGMTGFRQVAVGPDDVSWVAAPVEHAFFPTLNSPSACPTKGKPTALVGISGDGTVVHSGLYADAKRGSIALTADDRGRVVIALEDLVFRAAPDVSGNTPLSLACVANGASFVRTPMSRGGLMTIFGNGLGASPAVTVNEAPVEIPWADDRQINFIAPAVLSDGVANICVSRTQASRCIEWDPAAPGFYKFKSATRSYVAALNHDGSIHSQANPARRGEIVSLFATGTGWPTGTILIAFEDVPRVSAGVPDSRWVAAEIMNVQQTQPSVTRIDVRVPPDIVPSSFTMIEIRVDDSEPDRGILAVKID